LDYARKKYAGEPVGEYWIALARKATADLSKALSVPLPFSDDGNGCRAGAVREERALEQVTQIATPLTECGSSSAHDSSSELYC
jgi:hypothetical protein